MKSVLMVTRPNRKGVVEAYKIAYDPLIRIKQGSMQVALTEKQILMLAQKVRGR